MRAVLWVGWIWMELWASDMNFVNPQFRGFFLLSRSLSFEFCVFCFSIEFAIIFCNCRLPISQFDIQKRVQNIMSFGNSCSYISLNSSRLWAKYMLSQIPTSQYLSLILEYRAFQLDISESRPRLNKFLD